MNGIRGEAPTRVVFAAVPQQVAEPKQPQPVVQ